LIIASLINEGVSKSISATHMGSKSADPKISLRISYFKLAVFSLGMYVSKLYFI
jgi:hypothetical protein